MAVCYFVAIAFLSIRVVQCLRISERDGRIFAATCLKRRISSSERAVIEQHRDLAMCRNNDRSIQRGESDALQAREPDYASRRNRRISHLWQAVFDQHPGGWAV